MAEFFEISPDNLEDLFNDEQFENKLDGEVYDVWDYDQLVQHNADGIEYLLDYLCDEDSTSEEDLKDQLKTSTWNDLVNPDWDDDFLEKWLKKWLSANINKGNVRAKLTQDVSDWEERDEDWDPPEISSDSDLIRTYIADLLDDLAGGDRYSRSIYPNDVIDALYDLGLLRIAFTDWVKDLDLTELSKDDIAGRNNLQICAWNDVLEGNGEDEEDLFIYKE